MEDCRRAKGAKGGRSVFERIDLFEVISTRESRQVATSDQRGATPERRRFMILLLSWESYHRDVVNCPATEMLAKERYAQRWRSTPSLRRPLGKISAVPNTLKDAHSEGLETSDNKQPQGSSCS